MYSNGNNRVTKASSKAVQTNKRKVSISGKQGNKKLECDKTRDKDAKWSQDCHVGVI